MGLDIQSIPFTAIVDYFKIYGTEEDSFDDFLYLIRRMDNALLEAIESSKKTEGKKNDGKSTSQALRNPSRHQKRDRPKRPR